MDCSLSNDIIYLHILRLFEDRREKMLYDEFDFIKYTHFTLKQHQERCHANKNKTNDKNINYD